MNQEQLKVFAHEIKQWIVDCELNYGKFSLKIVVSNTYFLDLAEHFDVQGWTIISIPIPDYKGEIKISPLIATKFPFTTVTQLKELDQDSVTEEVKARLMDEYEFEPIVEKSEAELAVDTTVARLQALLMRHNIHFEALRIAIYLDKDTPSLYLPSDADEKIKRFKGHYWHFDFVRHETRLTADASIHNLAEKLDALLKKYDIPYNSYSLSLLFSKSADIPHLKLEERVGQFKGEKWHIQLQRLTHD